MRHEDFCYLADLTAAPGSTRALCEMVWQGLLPAWQRLPGGHLGWERDVLRAWFKRYGIRLVDGELCFLQAPAALPTKEIP